MQKKKSKEMDEKTQFLDLLLKMLYVKGQTYKEGPILDYIEKSIEDLEDSEHLTVVRADESFGLFCIVNSKKECKKTILLEAHCDVVQEELISPSIEKDTICATGLDNRGSCAILLNLIKNVRFEHTTYVVVFAVQEEVGFVGCKYFTHNISLKKNYGLEVDEIFVLDCTFGKLTNGYYDKEFTTFSGNKSNVLMFFQGDESIVPVIGKGFCPHEQDQGVPMKFIKRICDFAAFSKGYYKKVSSKHMLQFPVVDMHHKKSYASLNDLFSLYLFLKKRMKSDFKEEEEKVEETEKDEEKSNNENKKTSEYNL